MTAAVNIPLAGGRSMHDFALTASYLVLFDLPVTFSMDAVSAGKRLPYTWNPGHPARVGLLPRGGSAADIRWFDVDPCWIFHTLLNAFDDATSAGWSSTYAATRVPTTSPCWTGRGR